MGEVFIELKHSFSLYVKLVYQLYDLKTGIY